MKILVIGSKRDLNETREKFGEQHSYDGAEVHEEAEKKFVDCDVLFDFLIGDAKDEAKRYASPLRAAAFVDTSRSSLAELFSPGNSNHIFGFCGMPTFVNRKILEVSVRQAEDRATLKQVCDALGSSYEEVADKTGLVTPRVICMIINEAYWALEEGVATRDHIDLAMKLGTNYPQGPFEWCDRIGAENVVRLLNAVSKNADPERYRISPMLERQATQGSASTLRK